MATSAIYLHHERSTQAAAEADAQNREIVLDRTNLAPLGRFNDGTLWHGVTEEKPSVSLKALSVVNATALGGTLSTTGLSTLGGGAVITAATDSASKFQIGGSISGKVTALTGNTTLDNTYHTLECNATAGSFVVTLPAAAGCGGRRYAFHKNDVSANTVTIDANASETIDGALTIVIGGNVGNSHLVIVSNGTNWRIEWLYDEGTFTATLTGITAGGAGTARYVLVGKNVTLYLPNLVATSNAATCTITGLPTQINPARTHNFSVLAVEDNSVFYPGEVSIPATGIIALAFTTATPVSYGNVFTASGLKGLAVASTVSYNLA